jgi:hypothetical protein
MPEEVNTSHNGCPKCGVSITAGSKKCGSCGAVSLRLMVIDCAIILMDSRSAQSEILSLMAEVQKEGFRPSQAWHVRDNENEDLMMDTERYL